MPVYVANNPHEKAMQRALIQYREPKKYELVREALIAVGREDLIGFDRKCLIRPRHQRTETEKKGQGKSSLYQKGQKKKKTIRNIHRKKERPKQGKQI